MIKYLPQLLLLPSLFHKFMTVCLDTFQSSTPLPGPGPGRQEGGIQTSPAI